MGEVLVIRAKVQLDTPQRLDAPQRDQGKWRTAGDTLSALEQVLWAQAKDFGQRFVGQKVRVELG